MTFSEKVLFRLMIMSRSSPKRQVGMMKYKEKQSYSDLCFGGGRGDRDGEDM